MQNDNLIVTRYARMLFMPQLKTARTHAGRSKC